MLSAVERRTGRRDNEDVTVDLTSVIDVTDVDVDITISARHLLVDLSHNVLLLSHARVVLYLSVSHGGEDALRRDTESAHAVLIYCIREKEGERTGRRDLNEDDINANQTLLHHLGDAAEEDGDLRRVRLGRDGHT